ncbi:heme ABC exporter ATP-binding protein CcmA [Pseudochrobactrum sp. HB0163]|uniref:heme ABC exporter ATP-binding protein CcmA n=1 Tax=Pseudochrobactrum sp. HB0163 TaxID=3450708 RepID=UPI003F6DC1A9
MRLVAENLGGERAGNLLFNSLCATVKNGQALIITGSNGAGKSTLLRIIAGLLPAAEGAVWLETESGAEPVAVHSHYLSTLNGMKPALTVYENLQFWQDFHGNPLLEIDEALEMVGLGNIDHLPYGCLSTGQKRRVTIATLLCSHRPLWLLDEPTSGLDNHAQMMFAGIMRNHLASGGMIVAVTHIALGLEQAGTDIVRQLRLEDYRPQDHDMDMQDWIG